MAAAPALSLGWLLVLGVASALGLRGGYEPVMALFTCGIAALAFMRANRRERMLDG